MNHTRFRSVFIIIQTKLPFEIQAPCI